MKLIKKSALAVIKEGKLLLVRKRGSPLLLMPGGKPEGRETDIDALHREIKEELGCGIEQDSIVFLGTFEDIAAEKDARVSIDLFIGALKGVPKASSEIEEIAWADSSDSNISPIIKNKIMPFLIEKRMLI